MANYTVRTLKVKHLKECAEKSSTLKRKKASVCEREVKQFHYTTWPDHGVPCHPLPVLTYIRKSVASNPADGGPIVVHCSAGVGRTGTYIAIDAMLQQVRAKNEFNVFGFLKHIRGQRNYLVQTEEQYVFIHDALLEATLSGNTEILRENLTGYIEKLNEPVLTEGLHTDGAGVDEADQPPSSDEKPKQTKLDKQFEMVTAFSPAEYLYSSARMEVNVAKNRTIDLLPIESSRIPLAPKPGVEGSDYINASWLHGHNKLKEFILCHHPPENVREDFWRMLWDHNAQTVVLLSSISQEGFSPFWPEKESDYDLETFRVRFIEEALHAGHSTFDFVVSSQHDDYELAVRIIYCPEWPRNVTELEEVFTVLKVVQDWHLEYQDGPLVVVDKFGGTEGATFCSLTTLCKELDTFNAIDVYQVAKLYHNKRPGIWKSPDDLLYLYKAIEALVASKRANPVHDSNMAASTIADMSQCGGGSVTVDMDAMLASTHDALKCVTNVNEKRHSSSPPTHQKTLSNGGVSLVRSSSGHGFESATTTTTTTTTADTADDEHNNTTATTSLLPTTEAVQQKEGSPTGSSSRLNGIHVTNGDHDLLQEDEDDEVEPAEVKCVDESDVDETTALTAEVNVSESKL